MKRKNGGDLATADCHRPTFGSFQGDRRQGALVGALYEEKEPRRLGEPRLPATELWFSRGSKEGTSLVVALSHPLEGAGGDQIRPCPERFQAGLVPASDRDGLRSSGRPANGVSCLGWYYYFMKFFWVFFFCVLDYGRQCIYQY